MTGELFRGDCTAILPSLPEASVQLAVTSPPYNTGQEYSAGEWKVSQGKEGPSVTVPIRGAKKGLPPHDAVWSVKIGETVDMKPNTIDANNITLHHNTCRK